MQKFVSILSVLLVLAVSACSHHGGNHEGKNSGDDLLNSSLEEGSVLNFFDTPGTEKGLVVRSIKWGQPITSENPGADCELKRKGGPTPGSAIYSCVVRKGADAVVLTMHEDANPEGKRQLKKITLDGKGVATRDRWTKFLQNFGYAGQGGKSAAAKAMRTHYSSPDKSTDLQVVWAPAAKAVTLIFSSSRGIGEKASGETVEKKSKASKKEADQGAEEQDNKSGQKADEQGDEDL